MSPPFTQGLNVVTTLDISKNFLKASSLRSMRTRMCFPLKARPALGISAVYLYINGHGFSPEPPSVVPATCTKREKGPKNPSVVCTGLLESL